MSILKVLLLSVSLLNLGALNILASTNEVIYWPFENIFPNIAQSYSVDDTSSFTVI